jgi:hypothetical protein
MNAEPALVWTTKLSLKPRRNCTAGAASEPKVAVAIMQEGVGEEVVVGVVVIALVTVNWAVSCSPLSVVTMTA